MAWTGSGKDRFLRRQPAGEDRISSLSDDLLLLILRRLDTRTALGTGLLSSRWASLPRELPALDFRVGDILPPRYHRWIRLHRDRRTHALFTEKKHILPNIRRYERRAMRALASSVGSILDAPDRRVKRLRLEFFITTYDSGRCCMNRLIAKAVDAWGVDDLEAVAKPTYCLRKQAHTFPSHGLCKEPRRSRLRRLKLGGCVLPPMLHEYGALTTLVLHNLPESTPTAAYEGVFTSCHQLQVLHLNSCGCSGDKIVVIDAPMSRITELVVDNCAFHPIRMRALPSLESVASLQTRVYFESSSCPSLRRWNFALRLGVVDEAFRQCFKSYLELLEIDSFFQHTPEITNMIIRFTGPDRWFVPSSSLSLLLPNLRRLLVADVPSSWDVAWPRLLLEMAPFLEIFHIHITPCLEEPNDELSWQPTKLRQHHLEEFVMTGFTGTERQIYLVKFVMGVCTALQCAILSKNGYARDKGHWDWEMVTHQYSWSDEDKDTILKQITNGVSSSTVVHLV